MVIQNESVDEDLEHFEDIAEEEEDQARPTQNGTNNVDKVLSRNDGNNGVGTNDGDKVLSRNDGIMANTDSSSDNEVPAASDSEDGDTDEPSRWFTADGSDNLEESKSVAVRQKQESEAANVRSLLPGGYNPRHREPSFWYFQVLVDL